MDDNGTFMVKNITGTSRSSIPDFLAAADNFLYFRAFSLTDGIELWRTDGTDIGTEMLGNIAEGSSSSTPSGIFTIGDDVYTKATDIIHGIEIWKYDDADQTLELQGDINGVKKGFSIGDLMCFEDELSFLFKSFFEGNAIQKIDSNTGLTTTVTDGSDNQVDIRNYLGKLNGIYYFTGKDTSNQIELWRSDGTTTGTFIVKNINPDASSGIENVTFTNDKIYFSASNGQNGKEPWVSDGTAAGTFQLIDATPGQSSSHSFNFVEGPSSVFLSVSNRIWSTDGTQQGTLQLTDFTSIYMVPFLNGVLFTGADSNSDIELYFTGDTPGSTVLVKDVNPTASANPSHLTIVGDKVYFSANASISGADLWVTDGTTAGTTLVKDINPGSSNVSIGEMVAFQNGVTFVLFDDIHGIELWKSDGTTAGTDIVLDIVPGIESSFPHDLLVNDEILYFVQGNLAAIRNIWQTDCTAEGTLQISTFTRPSPRSAKEQLFLCNDRLYILAAGEDSFQEVFDVLCNDECAIVQQNTWTGPSTAVWQQTPYYWDKAIPTYCDDVIIPAGNNVIIDDTKIAIGRTLDVQDGASLETLINAELDIRN